MSDDRNREDRDPFDARADAPADAALDALFAEARDAAAGPLPVTFREALLADARRVQPLPVRVSWGARIRALLADFGGAPSLAGVGAAGLAGLWIGIAAPGPTADLVSSFWQGASGGAPGVAAWTSEGTVLDYTGAELLTLLDSETD
ncbi:hypothetical protein [Pararhodobacter marinus]|uniref:hypothetical protein n=1 Tax=Pararhodobacter marinus TaxID=2184063 RepID=UPI003518A454